MDVERDVLCGELDKLKKAIAAHDKSKSLKLGCRSDTSVEPFKKELIKERALRAVK
jgi:hypothetical protein